MPSDPKHILIIRPSALGDVCRTVPVLVSLRRAFPEASISWVVQDDFIPAVEAHPDLNQVVSFPRSRLAGWWKSPRRLAELLAWFARLRKSRPDLVLDCQGLGRSGLMAFVSGGSRRVGLRAAREFAWLGYNVRVPDANTTGAPVHTVDQMLSLVQSLGVPAVSDMRLYVAQQHARWWTTQRHELGLGNSNYAVIAPTARWMSKRWPIDRFAQIIEPLQQRGFEKTVVIGSPSEVEQVRDLFAMHPPERGGVIDLVGKTTIGQTMAVIAQAGLVIANDSAPLHMAVGFERPCVALFGPTDPAVVGPYRLDHAVIRGYAAHPGESINFKDSRLGDKLMRFISTSAVLQRIDRVLAEPDHPEPSERSRINTPRNVAVESDLSDRVTDGLVEGAAS